MKKVTLILALALLCFTLPAWAQRDLGTIVGTVTDPTGGVIAGARVTITEDATSLSYQVQTDSGGNYVRPALKPGIYSVQVEATGFKTGVQRNVTLTAGDRVQANVSMQVGDVAESIEVSAAPPALQTESTIIGQTIQARSTSELPLGGQRKFTYLARLSPSVVPGEPGARDAAGGAFSANGVRSNGQNNFLLNGVDNNVNVIDFINQTAYVVGPSVEAIGEMKILTNGYNAEYGRGAGGVVNVTIKSGTNDIHGVLFENLQNDKLDANKWENNRAGAKRGPFKQNLFGVAIGGPIIRDKLFWFADYQGIRIRSTGGAVPGLGNTFTRSIPWPAYKTGDFSRLLTGGSLGTDAAGNNVPVGGIFDPLNVVNGARQMFPGNRIPQSRFDPAAATLIGQYPNPNQNLGERLADNNFIVVTSGRQQNDQGDLRLDYRLSDKDSLFGSLSWVEESKFQTPPLPGLLDAGGFAGESEQNQSRNAMMSWTRVWSPTFLTETRLAFSRLITQRTQANSTVDAFREAGIGGINPISAYAQNGGLPAIAIDGYSTVGGSEWLPTLEYNNVWDFIENVSIIKSGHAMKFGFEYRPIDFPFFQVPSPRGIFGFRTGWTSAGPGFDGVGRTGDGIATWLLGMPGSGTRITTANFISSQKTAYAGYFQDDWKVSRTLTLNLGVRYELFTPIGEKFGRQSGFEYAKDIRNELTLVIPKGPNQDAPLPPNFATTYPQIVVERGVVDKYMIPWDKNNFSPRIGLAWQAVSRTVIRAGYGIFYGGEENEGGDPNRGESLPFNQEAQLIPQTNYVANPFIRTFAEGFPLDTFSLPAPIRFRTPAWNFRTPLVHKWNFAIQRELGFSTVAEISYVGSKGQNLLVLWNANNPVNHPDPGALRAPRRIYGIDTDITEAATFGRSNYHGLNGKLEKRFSNGLDFLMAYTWGHALTDVGTTLTGGGVIRDARNFRESGYANANFDVRHRFTTSFMYELPFGRGRMFGSGWNRAANSVLGGWQINGIVTMLTGFPRSITAAFNSCACNARTPDVVSGKSPSNAPSGGRTPDLWFDTTAVMAPALGTPGNLGSMSIFAPGTRNVDFSLFKRFSFTERYALTFRSEFFNISNTPQFDPTQMSLTQGGGGFGRINGTIAGTERHVQFALRFEF
ncbi:MAG: TonB-dependent receptor [Bryobacteraceae bacterium]|nr:TonB-dependent receptor [Bryobacteraceae bacterium]